MSDHQHQNFPTGRHAEDSPGDGKLSKQPLPDSHWRKTATLPDSGDSTDNQSSSLTGQFTWGKTESYLRTSQPPMTACGWIRIRIR